MSYSRRNAPVPSFDVSVFSKNCETTRRDKINERVIRLANHLANLIGERKISARSWGLKSEQHNHKKTDDYCVRIPSLLSLRRVNEAQTRVINTDKLGWRRALSSEVDASSFRRASRESK